MPFSPGAAYYAVKRAREQREQMLAKMSPEDLAEYSRFENAEIRKAIKADRIFFSAMWALLGVSIAVCATLFWYL